MIVQSAILHEGKIYTGKRHRQCFDSMVAAGIDQKELSKGIQGFVTDRGRFLDRISAGRHALKIQQIIKLAHPPELYSEDIY